MHIGTDVISKKMNGKVDVLNDNRMVCLRSVLTLLHPEVGCGTTNALINSLTAIFSLTRN